MRLRRCSKIEVCTGSLLFGVKESEVAGGGNFWSPRIVPDCQQCQRNRKVERSKGRNSEGRNSEGGTGGARMLVGIRIGFFILFSLDYPAPSVPSTLSFQSPSQVIYIISFIQTSFVQSFVCSFIRSFVERWNFSSYTTHFYSNSIQLNQRYTAQTR